MRGNLKIWAQKFTFERVLWFFWDLGLILFDTHKDAVFLQNFVLSNIFGFPVVNRVPKSTISVNFGCIPFEPKDYLCSKSQHNQTIIGGVRPKTPQEGTILWLLNHYEKPWKFLTSQTQMLYWWNLPQIYILIRSFICQNVGV